MDNKQIVAVGAIIINKDKEVLLVKRADNDDFLPGMWEFPGGKIEHGENLPESVMREVNEECGIKVEVGYPFTTATFIHENVQYVEVFFFCRFSGENSEVTLSHEHSDKQWIHSDHLKDFEFSNYLKEVVDELIASPILKL